MKRFSAPAAALLAAVLVLAWPQGAFAQPAPDAPQGRTLSRAEMLLAGAEADRRDVVLHLLQQGVDPDAPGKNGTTALMVAAGKGHDEIVELLLKHGADPNMATNEGWTAVMEAAFRDHADTIRLLTGAGALVDIKESRSGRTPLMIAAKSERHEPVTALVEAGADVNAVDEEQGVTALHYALTNPNVLSDQIAAELLVGGADPALAARDGYTPLMSAVESGSLSKVSLILSEGVDMEAKTDDGRRALTIAAEKGFEPIARRIVEKGAKIDTGPGRITALTQAVRQGNADVAGLLLEKGADPNRAAEDGRKPLMLAARGGFTGIVRALLDNGADIDGLNADDGSTALMWAANNGRLKIVELLIERGADVSIVAEDGWTAAKAARMAGHTEIVNLIEQRT